MRTDPAAGTRRDFPGRRWLLVTLRSLHLVGVVLVEAVLLDLAYRVARIRPLVIKVHLVALPVLVWAMAGAALAGAAAVLAVALWALLNRKGVV